VMSLHLFSVALMSISSNTDSFAIAVAYGIKKVRIGILPNFSIVVVSSFGTFVSMSIGETIGNYLPRSISNTIGSGVLIAIGLFGIWSAIVQARQHQKIAKRRPIESSDRLENYIYIAQIFTKNTQRYINFKESVLLAFSLTINNVGGGIGAGISHLNIPIATGLTFILAILSSASPNYKRIGNSADLFGCKIPAMGS
jgi:putative sporulation protein YtaF